ncbi:MAG: hypothetical protein HYT87_08940 [Nitrospirae bacterium]|nr:hypothetical protein [Nitrospirota bacterium]
MPEQVLRQSTESVSPLVNWPPKLSHCLPTVTIGITVHNLYANGKDSLNQRQESHIASKFSQRVAHGLMAKTFRSYEAAVTLVREGLPEDAMGVVRSMLETLLTVAYIFSDDSKTEERAARFLEFGEWENIRYQFHPDSLRHLVQSGRMTPEIKEKLESRRLEIEKRHGFKRHHWHPTGFRGLAEATKLATLYDYIYSYLSAYAHPTSSAFSSVFDFKPERVEVHDSRHFKDAHLILQMATLFFISVARAWDHRWDVGLKEKLEEAETQLRNVNPQ